MNDLVVHDCGKFDTSYIKITGVRSDVEECNAWTIWCGEDPEIDVEFCPYCGINLKVRDVSTYTLDTAVSLEQAMLEADKWGLFEPRRSLDLDMTLVLRKRDHATWEIRYQHGLAIATGASAAEAILNACKAVTYLKSWADDLMRTPTQA